MSDRGEKGLGFFLRPGTGEMIQIVVRCRAGLSRCCSEGVAKQLSGQAIDVDSSPLGLGLQTLESTWIKIANNDWCHDSCIFQVFAA